ncbi:MAG TPA: 2-dehydropantoate 2-reductase [Candidatus Binatia bacterium]|jgi:2-dehydropantoate 2-reductase|nr:2-dehydropantoate 2-reductase [Candidatus Binatia bacterium]
MAATDGPVPVLVAGAGALGSVVGGLVARRGWPVTLLGRHDHLDAVARDGLFVEGLYGDHHVRGLACATSADELQGTFGAILLTVKAWDTAAMSAAIAPRLAVDGTLISMQNGLGNLEAAAEVVGAARVLGARVIFGSEIAAPGRVRVTVHAAPTLIGSPTGGDDAAVRWAAALADAGIPSEPTRTLLAELWAKVFYSAALNPLGALLGVPYGWLPDDPDARAIMDEVIGEAFAVAVASGVELPWTDADAYRALFFGRLVPSTARHRSSMLQDLERGRPTEIDAINGWVVRRGAALGVPTPTNATLTRMIHARVRRARTDEAPWRN